MWSPKNLWPFTKRKQTTTKDKELSGEKQFLAKLAQVKSLAKEQPVMDGAALVVGICHKKLVCEVIIEVRLPGWTNWPYSSNSSKHGRLLVYLQNNSDEPLKVRAPEFILTGGLKLPWKAGVELMVNLDRTEIGEILSWQVPITGHEAHELLASEVIGILNKCRTIVAGTGSRDP